MKIQKNSPLRLILTSTLISVPVSAETVSREMIRGTMDGLRISKGIDAVLLAGTPASFSSTSVMDMKLEPVLIGSRRSTTRDQLAVRAATPAPTTIISPGVVAFTVGSPQFTVNEPRSKPE